MFTGIIEEVGNIEQIRSGRDSAVITVNAKKVLENTVTGDSIAVNGICLTVTALKPDGFMADVMHETINRSALSTLKRGSPVNLERAMPADGRFGGHIVAGHADGTGRITRMQQDANAVWFTISADEKILKYIVEKGSVAVDGISLTVAWVTNTDFRVSVIPHTLKQTALAYKRIGDPVNLETDIIGKYVEKFIRTASSEDDKDTLTIDFLMANGF